MGSSDKEEIDSNDDTVLADIAKWRDTTVMENNKREIYFLNILIPEALSIEIATQTNEYALKHIEQLRKHQTKIGTQPMQRKSRLFQFINCHGCSTTPCPRHVLIQR
jgi:hypothetical protein